MALTKTNVNLFLKAKTAEKLVQQQIINNAINGVHYNYQTPVYDGKNWFVWFFEDLERWVDPNSLDEQDLINLGGVNA